MYRRPGENRNRRKAEERGFMRGRMGGHIKRNQLCKLQRHEFVLAGYGIKIPGKEKNYNKKRISKYEK